MQKKMNRIVNTLNIKYPGNQINKERNKRCVVEKNFEIAYLVLSILNFVIKLLLFV